MGEVGSSMPNVRDTIQRHSSVPIIEQPIPLPEIVLPGATQEGLPGSTRTVLPPFESDSLPHPQFMYHFSSGSEDGGLEFHPGERVSHIIRDFPTPPDMTPTAATVLSPYFAEQSTEMEMRPLSPGHIQQNLEHSS